MRAGDIVAATTVSRVFVALGGDQPTKFGRARAFYRDGNNRQAVSLNEAKGCWYDHRDHVGGGILDLIQRVLGCNRAAALRWLSDFTGIPLEDRRMTPSERRNYARAARNTDALALRLADFTRGLELVIEETLRDLSDSLIDDHLDPTGALVKLHHKAHFMRTATPREIAASWRVMRQKNPVAVATMERIGREDREHAEEITNAIVDVLAASAAQEAD